MILQVNADWRIVSDVHQWIVQKRKVVKGEDVWVATSWFTTPVAAVWWLVQRRVRDLPGTYPCADAIEVLGTHLHEIGEEIKCALKETTDD